MLTICLSGTFKSIGDIEKTMSFQLSGHIGLICTVYNVPYSICIVLHIIVNCLGIWYPDFWQMITKLFLTASLSRRF